MRWKLHFALRTSAPGRLASKTQRMQDLFPGDARMACRHRQCLYQGNVYKRGFKRGFKGWGRRGVSGFGKVSVLAFYVAPQSAFIIIPFTNNLVRPAC